MSDLFSGLVTTKTSRVSSNRLCQFQNVSINLAAIKLSRRPTKPYLGIDNYVIALECDFRRQLTFSSPTRDKDVYRNAERVSINII